MSMKKTTVGILTSIIVVSAGTVSVFAAGQAKGRNFTDVDGNGICNNAKWSVPMWMRIKIFEPTAEISIDINPSLELELNRFNRVLSVES